MDPIQVSAANLRADFPGAIASLVESLVKRGNLFRQGDSFYYVDPAGTVSPFGPHTVPHMRADRVLSLTEGAAGAGDAALRPSALAQYLTMIRDGLTAGASREAVMDIQSHVLAPAFRIESGVLMPRMIGYDARDRILCTQALSPRQFNPEFPLLRKLWSCLLFADPVYEANLLGFTCAMFARTACRHFPFLIITGDGPTGKSMGKSTVAGALGLILTGREVDALTYSGSEDELERRIGTFAGRPGPNLIFFDNVRGKRRGEHSIHSQTIAQATSSHSLKARRLYSDPVPVFDPILCFTMNGARVEADLADRLVQIMLTLPKGVENRAISLDGLHLPLWVAEHRPELLAEVVGVLTGLCLATDLSTRMYEFEGVALAAARRLGLAPNYGQSSVHVCDAFLEELVNLLDGQPDWKMAASNLPSEIRGDPNYRDLTWFLETTRAGKNTLARRLLERLENVTGKTYRTRIGVVSFTLEHDYTLNQRVLVMKKEA